MAISKQYWGYRIACDGNNGLVPTSSLIPNGDDALVARYEFRVTQRSGVRCFYDDPHPEVLKKIALDDVLELERRYSQQESWRSIARYQHMICVKFTLSGVALT